MVCTLVASAPMSAFAGEMQQEYEQTVEQVHGELLDKPDAEKDEQSGFHDVDDIKQPAEQTEAEQAESSKPAVLDASEGVGEVYTEGWISVNGKRHWQHTDGTYACNTWIDDNGKKYYLDANGDLTVGWKKLDYDYFFQEDGTLAVNRWIGKQYVDANGRLDTSVIWHQPEWKKNSTGWGGQNEDGSYPAASFKEINGATYYFDNSGYMVTGWQLIHGSWYYFRDSGSMVAGSWMYIKGSWYYLDASGIMRTGWQKIDGQWYYLQGSGAMSTGWLWTGNSWYYLNGSGAMVTGWICINNSWYYLTESGAMATGWQMIHGNWYYLQGSGAMSTGWLWTGNSWYYLNGSGAMVTGWIHIRNSWYYLSESGAMVTGWQMIDNVWYYFYGNGVMAANTWIGSYYLTGSGAWASSANYDDAYRWPCPGYTRVSSDYGPRSRPTAGASSYHRGIDIAAPAGTAVSSIHRGTVQSYGYDGTMGNYVKISHGNGVVSVYMHMSRIANIHTGMSVSAGTTIGYVGATGVATGAHLHLGILLNGSYVSPWSYVSRP